MTIAFVNLPQTKSPTAQPGFMYHPLDIEFCLLISLTNKIEGTQK